MREAAIEILEEGAAEDADYAKIVEIIKEQ